MTIYNLAINIVRPAVDVWLQMLFVIEMKRLVIQLERRAAGGQNAGQTSVTHVAGRQMSIDREQFVGQRLHGGG